MGEKKRLAVLVSGNGSNLQAILDAIATGKLSATVSLVISNKAEVNGLKRASAAGIPALFVEHGNENEILTLLSQYQIDYIVLAGYMKLLSPAFIAAYPLRIVNIHPSLLPAFPGLHVQQKAWEYGVRFAGCTVHFVDAGLDSGPIIHQGIVPVLPEDTAETLRERILKEEHKIFPEAIEWVVTERLKIDGRRVLFR